MKKPNLYFYCSFLLVTILSCTPRSPVATLGDYALTQKDIDCRDAVIHQSFPGEKRKLGLQQLIRSYQNVQILKNHQEEITAEKIKKEKERINKATLMPEKLDKIKSACGGEEAKPYENAFIIPTLADRTIYYDFFLKNQAIHKESFVKATEWREKLTKTPQQFKALAKKENIPVSSLTVSLERGIEWKNMQKERERQEPKNKNANPPPPPNSKPVPLAIQKQLEEKQQKQISHEGAKWINEIINPLKPGQISPQIIDQSEVWLVVQYLKPSKKEKDSFQLQAAVFPKKDYGAWLETERSKVTVKYAEK